jgi:hypothetical protein
MICVLLFEIAADIMWTKIVCAIDAMLITALGDKRNDDLWGLFTLSLAIAINVYAIKATHFIEKFFEIRMFRMPHDDETLHAMELINESYDNYDSQDDAGRRMAFNCPVHGDQQLTAAPRTSTNRRSFRPAAH